MNKFVAPICAGLIAISPQSDAQELKKSITYDVESKFLSCGGLPGIEGSTFEEHPIARQNCLQVDPDFLKDLIEEIRRTLEATLRARNTGIPFPIHCPIEFMTNSYGEEVRALITCELNLMVDADRAGKI